MQHLPEEEERDWILDGLADLVRKAGLAPFVAAPIIDTTRRFLPEPYSPTLPAVDRLTRRLMQYSGLGNLDVRIEPYTPDDVDDRHSLAYFAGFEKGTAIFGINVGQVADLEPIAGVMAHEVAHAFRRHRGLAVEDHEEEELLTDLTTIYLGLGALTANASWRYRAGGEIQGSYAVTRWVTTAAGYLPPQAFSFALGTQLVARNPAPREWKRVLASLETNQRAFARAAIDELSSDREKLLDRLGLAEPSTWPPVALPETILRPLPSPPEYDDWTESEDEEPLSNVGRPVFRVPEDHVILSTVLPGWIAASAGMLITGVLFDSMSGAFAGFGGAALGFWVGMRRRFEICSDPECRTKIPPEAVTCPGCGGTISGKIKSANDRLEAEERLAEGRFASHSAPE